MTGYRSQGTEEKTGNRGKEVSGARYQVLGSRLDFGAAGRSLLACHLSPVTCACSPDSGLLVYRLKLGFEPMKTIQPDFLFMLLTGEVFIPLQHVPQIYGVS